MLKLKEKMVAVSASLISPRGAVVGSTLALVGAGSLAGAQTQTPSSSLNFGNWIASLQTTAIEVINSAGPALFGLMAIIGGVFFVWNRVRSLW